MTNVEQNPNRLLHLLSLFQMTKEDLLSRISIGLKKALTEKDVFGEQIKLSTLKKIDAIFNKGLSYYIDPSNPTKTKGESIFFRKNSFNADLSLGAKQIVNKYEEEKIRYSAIIKGANFKIRRLLSVYAVSDDAKYVANTLRERLYPDFLPNKRDFLKSFIGKLADHNILVYEFVESFNRKEKANIDGFYLAPNVIVLKRAQKYFSREIFTLAHELGHYLLNEEDIDDNVYDETSVKTHYNSNEVEAWCNDFAYYFLAGGYDDDLMSISIADADNDYYSNQIRTISEKTHLSSISLYTRLLLNDKISYTNYLIVKEDILSQIKEREEKLKEERELDRQKLLAKGEKIYAQQPKPIISPLLLDTMRAALDVGFINEYEFCRRLNIKPDKIEEYYA